MVLGHLAHAPAGAKTTLDAVEGDLGRRGHVSAFERGDVVEDLDIADVLGDLLNLDGLVLIGKCRVTGDDEKTGDI